MSSKNNGEQEPTTTTTTTTAAAAGGGDGLNGSKGTQLFMAVMVKSCHLIKDYQMILSCQVTASRHKI